VITDRFAAPHTQRDEKTVVIRPFSLPSSVAAGGCAMSVENLLQYARFHLAGTGLAADGEELLSAASLLRQITSNHENLRSHFLF